MSEADDREELAVERTHFAEDRTVQATERTFAGWLRTAFAAIGVGLGFHVIFGELDGSVSDRAQRVAGVFARAGVAHHLSRHIAIMLWDKLSWNAAFNACTAVARRTVGELLARPDGRVLVRAAMLEVVAVANASGVRLDAARVDPEIERSAVELASLKTSMQQDRERGRRLEHEALNGAVVRAADRTGVQVPVNRVLYGLLSVLDRQARSAPVRPR